MAVMRVLAAARFAGAPVKLENVNWGDEERRNQLRTKSSTQTFPYLQTTEGTISQSYAIIQYFADAYNQNLLGTNTWERAQVDQWVDFAQLELAKNTPDCVYPIFGFRDYVKENSDNAQKNFRETLRLLDTHLEGKTYVVGQNVTLADLELFYVIKPYFELLFVDQIRKQFMNVLNWFNNLANNQNILQSYGRVILCKTPHKVPKIEKTVEKKPEQKKEEKAAEKPKAAEGEESNKKKGNPLDLLPPSTFILDEFKREFMNSPNRPEVMSKFWGKFDPNGFSFWKMKYDKLPTEGKILFRTKNSMGFFLQKLDTFRKYTFSVHGIYGVEENYDIRGVWMWRGTEIPEEVKQHDSYEYMFIDRLDTSKPEDRKFIEEYWLNLNEGDIVDGMPVAYVETFK